MLVFISLTHPLENCSCVLFRVATIVLVGVRIALYGKMLTCFLNSIKKFTRMGL